MMPMMMAHINLFHDRPDMQILLVEAKHHKKVVIREKGSAQIRTETSSGVEGEATEAEAEEIVDEGGEAIRTTVVEAMAIPFLLHRSEISYRRPALECSHKHHFSFKEAGSLQYHLL